MRFFYTILFSLITIYPIAQEVNSFRYEDEPLTTLLKDIEIKFNVKFAYNASKIRYYNVVINIDKTSLEEIISKIEKAVQVSFKKVDDYYYIIETLDFKAIKGVIVDANTQLPINGAQVYIKNKTLGKLSDKNGFFEIKNSQYTDTLEISHLGYKTKYLPVNDIDSTEENRYIPLQKENILLNEIIVKEYLTQGIDKSRDGAVEINPNSINVLAGLPEPDILHNIQLLSGIESPEETASGLYIRGGTPDQNLILWDGIKVYSSDHFFGMLSSFNPYIVDDIKIYRSGAKVEYGDRVSGIIDIKTKNKIPERVKIGAGANMTHGDLYLNIPITSNSAILLSGRRSLFNNFSTPTLDTYSTKVFQNTVIAKNQDNFNVIDEEIRFLYTDVNLKYYGLLNKSNKLSISSLFANNELVHSYKVNGFMNKFNNDLNIENGGIILNLNSKLSNIFSSIAEIYFYSYNLLYDGVNSPNDVHQGVFKENNIDELGFRLHSDIIINKSLKLNSGYQYFSNHVSFILENSSFAESDNRKGPTHSLYSGVEYSKSDSWYLNVGIRGNYYKLLNKVYFVPRIYTERKLGNAFRLKGSAEVRFQAVSQIVESFSQELGLESQVWKLSNDINSPLLRSEQFSFGFIFNKKGWILDSDIYLKNIDGFTYLTKGFTPVSQESNLTFGNSITKGLDILLKKKVRNYTTWISYTYSDSRYQFDQYENLITFRANNDIRHSFTWSHSYTYKSLQFSLGWKFRTGTPYTEATGILDNSKLATVKYAGINEKTLPYYHRLDFSVIHSFNFFKNKNFLKGKLGVSFINIYNRKNILKRTYSIIELTDDNNKSYKLLKESNKASLKFTPNLFFRINF